MNKIEVDRWDAKNLLHTIHRLQRQSQTILGLIQATRTLFGEIVRKSDELPSGLESLANQCTAWLREPANTAGQGQQGMSTSPGSILSGEAAARTLSTAGVSTHPAAPHLNPPTPEAATAAPSKGRSRTRSGGAGKRNGKSRGSPRLASAIFRGRPAPLSMRIRKLGMKRSTASRP